VRLFGITSLRYVGKTGLYIAYITLHTVLQRCSLCMCVLARVCIMALASWKPLLYPSRLYQHGNSAVRRLSLLISRAPFHLSARWLCCCLNSMFVDIQPPNYFIIIPRERRTVANFQRGNCEFPTGLLQLSPLALLNSAQSVCFK